MKYPDRFIAVDPGALPWNQAMTPNGPKGIQYKSILHENASGLPYVHFNRYEPNWTEPRHRHAEDEVLILTAGVLEIEGTRYAAPAVLYVGRHTLYGPLTAGGDGAEFYRVAFSEKLMRLPGHASPEAAGDDSQEVSEASNSQENAE